MTVDKHTPEELSGKAKEAAGDLTGNGRLKREGQADQAKAHVKRGVDKVADTMKDAVD